MGFSTFTKILDFAFNIAQVSLWFRDKIFNRSAGSDGLITLEYENRETSIHTGGFEGFIAKPVW